MSARLPQHHGPFQLLVPSYTGRWPMRHRAGVMKERSWLGRALPNRLTSEVPTLAEVLRDHGFATGAVMNNPYLDQSFGVPRGFDVYDHVPGDNQDIRRADVMVARALELIDRWGDRPFFLVLHLFDPHMDYDPQAPRDRSVCSRHRVCARGIRRRGRVRRPTDRGVSAGAGVTGSARRCTRRADVRPRGGAVRPRRL